MKKVFILLGHPDKSGMNGHLADAYEAGAREAGHEVRRQNLGEMQFDPILHKGYRAMQELEPDLKAFQENVTWCDHFVIFYPVWWVGMPALLKGLFDRAWLPGSAFRYMKMPHTTMHVPGMPAEGSRTIFWHRLFRGKTAHTVLTSGTAPWLVRFLPGNVNAQLKWGILWFAGFSVRSTWLGPAENVPEPVCTRWCDRMKYYGKKAK
jgi:putative NADPH-quinone reductase